jgi:hypothetical protein
MTCLCTGLPDKYACNFVSHPGSDHVEGERWLQAFELLQLQLFDAAAAFEDSEKNLDIPFKKPL